MCEKEDNPSQKDLESMKCDVLYRIKNISNSLFLTQSEEKISLGGKDQASLFKIGFLSLNQEVNLSLFPIEW